MSEEEIANKVKKILHDEFVIFCLKYSLDREGLIRYYSLKYFEYIDYINYSVLLEDKEELQNEWYEIEEKILLPFFIRYAKHLGIEEYRLLRYNLYSNKRYFFKGKLDIHTIFLIYPQFENWHKQIYLIASNVHF